MCKKLMQFIKHHIFSTHCPFKVFQGSNSDVKNLIRSIKCYNFCVTRSLKVFQGSNSDVKNVIRILNVYSALNGLALIK